MELHIQGAQLVHIKPHPSEGTKATYVVCYSRQELPGKSSFRQLGKHLPGNEIEGLAASQSHILSWPVLLGGEAFSQLGEALQFNSNSLRCF